MYSHAPLKAKSRHLASLEKPEEGETTGYRLSLVHGAEGERLAALRLIKNGVAHVYDVCTVYRGVCSDEIQVVRHLCAAFADPLWLIAIIE